MVLNLTCLKQESSALAALSVAWILAVLLVNPSGDFPLNDDFSYGKTVQNLVVHGRLHFDEWLAQTLLAQVLWGAGFCKIFGFSFTVLRISTLTAGLAGVFACYFIARELGQRQKIALLAALTVAFNPLFFSLSFTFMTDVHFFACLSIAVLFYLKSLRNGSLRWAVIGTFFAIAATFIRQLGIMLPLAFGMALLFRERFRLKALPLALLPFSLTIGLFLAWSDWFEAAQGLPDGYGNFSKLGSRINSGFEDDLLLRTGILLCYLGWFLLPLLCILKTPFGKWAKFGMAASLVVAVFCLAIALPRIPWGNIFFNLGLGPKLLKDGVFFINVSPVMPESGLWALRLVGAAGGLLFLWHVLPAIFSSLSSAVQRPLVLFAIFNLALYGGFLALDAHFFDRYFFQMLPFLLVCLLTSEWIFLSKKRMWMAGLFIGIQALVSITVTHDYLAWNRARWQALNDLTEKQGISPHQIDGGFEFNGWHKPGERTYDQPKSWWWVDRDDYVVAFGEMDGFSKIKSYPFVRWLPPGIDSVCILKNGNSGD